jgi:hypothetical protein
MAGNRWTGATIIAAIRELYEQDVDLSPTGIRVTHSALFSSARSRSHFGSWRAAVEAAGIDYDAVKRGEQVWSRDRIVRAIRDATARGEDLLSSSFKDRHKKLYSAACARRYFGGWRKAIEAAELSYDQIRSDHFWGRPKIMATIQEMARRGESLNWSAIEQSNPSLYRAARRKENFGSWQGALREAGVDFHRTGAKQWTRERIVNEIRRLHRQGVDLSQKNIMDVNGPLLAAAKSGRYFGTWRAAVEAAGIDYTTVRRKRGRRPASERQAQAEERGEKRGTAR